MVSFTKRESEILLLVAKAYNNKAISRKLRKADGKPMGLKTLERHLNSIYSKLKDSINDDINPRCFIVLKLNETATGEKPKGTPQCSNCMNYAPVNENQKIPRKPTYLEMILSENLSFK